MAGFDPSTWANREKDKTRFIWRVNPQDHGAQLSKSSLIFKKIVQLHAYVGISGAWITDMLDNYFWLQFAIFFDTFLPVEHKAWNGLKYPPPPKQNFAQSHPSTLKLP